MSDWVKWAFEGDSIHVAHTFSSINTYCIMYLVLKISHLILIDGSELNYYKFIIKTKQILLQEAVYSTALCLFKSCQLDSFSLHKTVEWTVFYSPGALKKRKLHILIESI